MPDYHDVFWRLLFQRIDCAIEFFRFLLIEKSNIEQIIRITGLSEAQLKENGIL
jgi:hypothetical protein